MIQGLSHFQDHFKDDTDSFVLVGGVASYLQLEAIAAPRVRPTKDLDIVLMAKPSNSFLNRFKAYIRLGQYEIEIEEGARPRFYHFRNPKDAAFPVMIELFASNAEELALFEDQHIIPVTNSDEVESLSAILIDGDYFHLLQKHIIRDGGISRVSELALIPLKAKACLDIKKRGEDSKKWKKHRGDIINLAATLLDGDQQESLTGKVLQDFEDFINGVVITVAGSGHTDGAAMFQ